MMRPLFILIFCALQCLLFIPCSHAQTSSSNEISENCPGGFICMNGKQESCDDIRMKVRDTFKFGDILAGTHCPGGKDQLVNCPIGQVCTNSTSVEPCPSGMFCPHKTSVPEIKCGACGVGSTTKKRPMFSYGIAATIFGLILLFLGTRLYFKHNDELIQKLRRMQNERFDAKKQMLLDEEHRAHIEKIRPSLEILLKRVESIKAQESAHDSVTSFSATIKSSEDGSFEFDSGAFYDHIFVDRKNGSVTYHDLNKFLKLNPTQLEEFTHRMNSLAGVSKNTPTFSRSIFKECFVPVFAEAKHFGPTPQECDELFEQIAGDDAHSHHGSIPEECFYTSELSEFLSDVQINHILTRIRQLRREEHAKSKKSGLRASLGRTFSMTSSLVSIRKASTRPTTHAHTSRRHLLSLGYEESSHIGANSRLISKEEFMKYYPMLLKEAASLFDDDEEDDAAETIHKKMGIDIAFQDLCLTLNVGGGTVRVVDSVTGRLKPGTMTALMGGSGAGKTSLLNALCGRASYGKVTGVTKINGRVAAIDEHSSLVGFVPQDDIVYPELTVRENFIYSGRFRLPQGTDLCDIEDLADQTIANLGLSRVANTIVGDVKRRGVSGGEKKRVNIGLELMAKPSTLFLDEPTSGLDSSSAFLVMNCVRSLVDKHGLSACSVIHQPRKSIFDLFDSLILLGAGGKMVYHGSISEVENYFTGLNYVSQPGESLADWLIDISTGHLVPHSPHPKGTFRSIVPMKTERSVRFKDPEKKPPKHGVAATIDTEKKPPKRGIAATKAMHVKKERGMSLGLDSIEPSATELNYSADLSKDLTSISSEAIEIQERSSDDTADDSAPLIFARRRSSVDFTTHRLVSLTPAGPSANKEAHNEDDAKLRREILFNQWSEHFNRLPDTKMEAYTAPEEYDIPIPEGKPSFRKQLKIQMIRYCLVWKRNFLSKLIDTVIIICTAAIISAMAGNAEVTVDKEVDVSFRSLVSDDPSFLATELPQLFAYALLPDAAIQQFTLRFGMVLAVLIGLTAAKDITDKQTEFFREAASGYDINAYFLAVNIMSSVEHLAQSFVASLIAWWIRQSISRWLYFCMSFMVLSWFATSWSLLIPLIVPPSNVTIVVGFFMTFFGLLFGGSLEPITFAKIYDSWGLQLFCGFFSPMRYFIESISVGEHRCLPEQSGYTMTEEATNFPMDLGSFSLLGLAGNDDSVTDQSCNGWYRGLVAPIFVGLFVRFLGAGLIHVCGRSKQAKKPLREDMKKDTSLRYTILAYVTALLTLFAITCWMILNKFD